VNALSIAFDSIWSHRLRSALTALGIVIGVFAVVTLTSLGQGVSSFVSGQFKTLGATVITVTPAIPGAQSHREFGGGGSFLVPSTLTLGDVTAISHLGSPAIRRAAAVATLPIPVAVKGQGPSGSPVLGVTAPYFPALDLSFQHGSFGQGVVLGANAAQRLFPGVGNPVGHPLTVGTGTLHVTGVLKSSKGLLTRGANDSVFMPVAAGLKIAGLSNISEILIQASGNHEVGKAASAVTRVLDRRHPLKDFQVTQSTQLLNTINTTLGTITAFLSGLAAISLLVGGIGIMNIMLVTVTERFREIGIRKALGARDGDILVQFLAESVLLAVLGGGVGMLLAALASQIIGHLAGFPAGLTVGSVVLALLFCLGVGVVFGVVPALRAARLMPAEALRTE
jgi:putative ABC transport system permease protein